MATNSLRRSVVRSFKLQGLTLQSSATSLLVEVLEPYQDDSDLEEIVDHIIEAVQKQPLTSSVVGREVMPLPPQSLSHPHSLLQHTYFLTPSTVASHPFVISPSSLSSHSSSSFLPLPHLSSIPTPPSPLPTPSSSRVPPPLILCLLCNEYFLTFLYQT